MSLLHWEMKLCAVIKNTLFCRILSLVILIDIQWVYHATQNQRTNIMLSLWWDWSFIYNFSCSCLSWHSVSTCRKEAAFKYCNSSGTSLLNFLLQAVWLFDLLQVHACIAWESPIFFQSTCAMMNFLRLHSGSSVEPK